MVNKERLTIEEQLEEIKECGRRFNDSQYYCLYKYDIERIIPYIEDLQQRIDKVDKYIDRLLNTDDPMYLDAVLITIREILGVKDENNT